MQEEIEIIKLKDAKVKKKLISLAILPAAVTQRASRLHLSNEIMLQFGQLLGGEAVR